MPGKPSVPGDRGSSNSDAIRIESPLAGSLVSGDPLSVKLVTAADVSSVRVTSEQGDVSSAFRRAGNGWVGSIRQVPGGRNTLDVQVVSGGRSEHANVTVTVKGRQQRLVAVTRGRSVSNGAVRDAGVKSLVVGVDPRANASASLNGQSVALPAAHTGTKRQVVLSADDGLRPGTNTFVVDAHRPDGSWQRVSRSFTVAAGAPMAEAGGKITTLAGDAVTLDGSRSRAARTGGTLTYHWQVISAPGSSAPSTLSSGASTAVLRLPKPGRYIVRLTAAEGTLSSSDLVTVEALADLPPLGQRIVLSPEQADGQGAGLQLGSTKVAWAKYFDEAKAGVYALDPQALTWPEVDNHDQSSADRQVPLFPQALSASDPDGDLKKFLAVAPPQSIIAVVGRDGCCAKSAVLPHSGPFSHLVSYAGNGLSGIADGSWNRDAQFLQENGDVGAKGALSGYLRRQTGGTEQVSGKDDGSDSPFFRFVADGDHIRYATAATTIATGDADDGATYQLTGPKGGLALGVTSTDPGPVRVATVASDIGQQWQLVRAYGQYFQLVNRRTKLCLNLSGSDGRTVLAWPCSGVAPPNELWLPLWDDATSSWTLQSATTNDPKHPVLLSRSDGTAVVGQTTSAPDQQGWNLAIPDGLYTITAGNDGRAAAEPDYAGTSNHQLVSAIVTQELSQRWLVEQRGAGAFSLRSVSSGMCATATAGSADAAIVRRPCNPSDASQNWLSAMTPAGLRLQLWNTQLGLSQADGKLKLEPYDSMVKSQPTWKLNRQPERVAEGFYVLTTKEGTTLRVNQAGAVSSGSVAGPQTGPAWQVVGQEWQLSKATQDSDGHDIVQLMSSGFRQCLEATVDGQVSSAGCQVQSAAPQQSWRLDEQADGSYVLQSVNAGSKAGRVLTAGDDGRLTTAADVQSPEQRWFLHGSTVSFAVGSRTYGASLPPGASGFAVLAVDRSARPVPGYPRVYHTDGADAVDIPSTLEALATDINQLAEKEGTTVLVQSIGRPRPHTVAVNDVANAFKGIGADPSSLLSMDGTGDIAITGCSRCSDAETYDERARRGADPSVVGARLQGSLSRDDDGTLKSGTAGPTWFDDTVIDLADRPLWKWPYGDPGDPGYAVLPGIKKALGTELPSGSTCGTGTGLDPIRRTYCLAQVTETNSWVSLAQQLHEMSDADIQAQIPKADADAYPYIDAVKAQLEVEWGQLDRVHRMVEGQRTLFANAVYTNTTDAQSVAGQIKTQLPANSHRKDGPTVGGVLTVVEEALALVAPESDVMQASVGLLGGILDLSGDNDDGSPGVDVEIDTEALSYANDLDAQYGRVIANLSSVENVLVSDPVKLNLAAANSSQRWSADQGATTQEQTLIARAAKADLWKKLLPTAFEMWQWPTIPAGLAATDISCIDETWGTLDPHYVYTGQDARGIFAPAVSINKDSGVARRTLVLTNNVNPTVRESANRILDKTLAQSFYTGTGLAPDEVPRELMFSLRNYSSEMKAGDHDCELLNTTTSKATQFGPKNY